MEELESIGRITDTTQIILITAGIISTIMFGIGIYFIFTMLLRLFHLHHQVYPAIHN